MTDHLLYECMEAFQLDSDLPDVLNSFGDLEPLLGVDFWLDFWLNLLH